MRLITIKTFENPIQAHIIKTRLESEDVLCFLFDENIVSINPLYNVLVGGIKLKIREEDHEKAQKILDDFDRSPSVDQEDKVIKCPQCQSSDLISGFRTIKGSKGIVAFIISFFLLIYPFYIKTVYKCRSCQSEFK